MRLMKIFWFGAAATRPRGIFLRLWRSSAREKSPNLSRTRELFNAPNAFAMLTPIVNLLPKNPIFWQPGTYLFFATEAKEN